MTKLVILQGLPFSGKTTWAKTWTTKAKKRIRLSRYGFCRMLSCESESSPVELRTIAYASCLEAFEVAVVHGWSVVLDDLNLQTCDYMPFVSFAQTHGVTAEFKKFLIKKSDVPKIVSERNSISLLRMEMYMERYPEYVK